MQYAASLVRACKYFLDVIFFFFCRIHIISLFQEFNKLRENELNHSIKCAGYKSLFDRLFRV